MPRPETDDAYVAATAPPPLPVAAPAPSVPPYAAGTDAGASPNPTYSTPAVLTLPPGPAFYPMPPYAAGVDVDATPNPTYGTPAVLTLPDAAPPDTSGGGDDFDAAERDALANDPDLSDLGPFELSDPFGFQFDALENQPLKGGGALTEIAQACSTLGVDALAAVANALHEGASGAIGDQGTAYGPFQIHATDGRLAAFADKGRNNATVNAWAWSANGLDYAVRSMVAAHPSARGLLGHAAVYAIVYGFERPADEKGAYRTRAAEYDHLLALGDKWAAYAAARMLGPVQGGAVDTVPIHAPGATDKGYVPAGVNAQWAGLMDFFGTTIPTRHDRVKSLAASLKGAIS